MPTPSCLGSPRAHPSQEGQSGKVLLPGGRVWNVGNILRKREYGGELFGSFVVHYSLKVGGSEKDVWWEDGRWFSREGA